MTGVRMSVDCRTAAEFDLPEVHRRCRANAALRIPPFQALVLPLEECGCSCHETPAVVVAPPSAAPAG